MTQYWIIIASKNQVLTNVKGGYAETGHGKAHPLRRMNVGDGVIYYSPKVELGETTPFQKFTAIGCVIGADVYQKDLGNSFSSFRRDVSYLSSTEAAVKPLVGNLSFIKDKLRWGQVFKFGILHIPAEDFKLIARAMNANMARSMTSAETSSK